MTALWSVGLVLLSGLFGAIGPLFLKQASDVADFRKIQTIILNYKLYIGIIFYAAGTLVFIPALKGGQLSVLYPLIALSYIWVAIFSRIFLKEKINATKWIGIFLILVGVSLVGLGS